MKTTYTYDSRGMLTNLVHMDTEGALDAYTHDYDRNGNKIQTKKERRGLLEESGTYAYEYDPAGRLSNVSKNEQQLRSNRYDPFGNRIMEH